MSIRSYFTVKQRDVPELETVVSSSVAEAIRTEVKWTIGMKHTADGEGNSIESKRGAYEKIAPKSRTKITKYAAENEIAAAICYFQKNEAFSSLKENTAGGRMCTVLISAGEREVI